MKVPLHARNEDWSLSDHTIEVLHSHLRPGLRTLETGAGYSTLLFAEAGCVHTAITPSADEVAKIQAQAASRGISMTNVSFIVLPSQEGIRHVHGTFDVVLIDGGHGFPVPQIDFFYGASVLRPKGLLVVDDVQLWSVRTIRNFLMGEKGWTHIRTIEGKTSFFRMEEPFEYREWRDQPYTESHSRTQMFLNYGRRACAHVRRGRYDLLSGAILRFVRRTVRFKRRALER